MIIDDLKQQTRPLAFFHFNQNVQVYDGVEPTQAIRAMAVQLLHQAREYPDTIDAVSLLMHSSWSGHTEASDGEAEAALEILCRLHSPYLVVDGVDESNNTDKVLTTMFTLCSVSDVSIITLGRPDIELPRRLAIDQTKPEIKIISPMEQNNIGDVRNFLQQEFDSMVELELFGTFDLSSNTVDSVAERAMGIFLWANLFVRYLNSHALTPRDRLEFLLESLRFEGLDGLCGAILNKLSRRMPMERALAARIFKWIGASIYPLTSEALHTALAINPGRQTTPQDHLAGFPSSLPVLSGALAEIDMFGRAAFIHLSVREYLMSPRCMDFPEFSLEDLASTHQYLAIRCLSYLAHDIPSEPLRYLPGNGPWTKGQDTTSPKLHHAHGREYLDNAHGYNINPMVTETPSNILLVSNLPMKMSIQDLSETFSSQPGFQAILLSKDDEKGITCSVEFDNTHHGVQALHEVDTSYYGNVRNSMRLSFASHSLHDDRTSPDVNRPYSYLAAPLRNVDRETDLRPAKKLRRSVKGVRVPPHPRREIPALDGMDPMVWDQHEIPVDRYPDQLDIGSDVRDYLPHRSKNVNAYTPVNHQDHMSAVHPGPDRPIHRAGVEQHYPLLKYATMFWPQHVRLSLHEKPQLSSRPRMQNDYSSTSRQPRQRSQYEPPYSFLGRPDGSSGSTTAMAALEGLEPTESGAPLWIPYLSRFLLRRGNFTTWVESSYCYRLTPSLRQILRIVKDIARDGSQDTGAQRELQWILHGLNQFSEALDELSAKHYQELRLDPTRLWDEDISAACDPDFWPTPSRAFASPMRESGSSTHTQGVHWLNAARSGLT